MEINMNSELSKDEILKLLSIYRNWLSGPEPADNLPDEIRRLGENGPTGIRSLVGMMLQLFLVLTSEFGLVLGIPKIAIWASRASVKYDYLFFEPISCGLNFAYTRLGLGYLKAGDLERAIECLRKSWHVYPCPHNTSFGLRLRLARRLNDYPEARESVVEYLDMRKRFII
jgi:tetratricopeptide (TPR) repeat protein